MKTAKILTILVVVMASMANADISLYIDGSPAPNFRAIAMYDTLTTQVYSSDTSWWQGYIISETGSANILSNAQTLSTAGSQGYNAPFSYAGLGVSGAGYELTTFSVVGDIAAGVQHTVDLFGEEPGITVVSLWDHALGYGVPVHVIDIYCGGDPGIENPWIVANAGGPYEIDEGETIILDGSGSNSKYGIQQWWWSIDGEYVGYGKKVSMSYDYLVSNFGVREEGYPLELRANSLFDGDAYDSTIISLRPPAPMGTAFMYQGRLLDQGSPADGFYDFQFKLFDDDSDGNPVGSDINKADVDVNDGYFTVQLDFGSGVFDGDARWLEIGVRPGELEDPNTYTTLSPRQELTPTPYAIHAQTAGELSVGGVPQGAIIMWSGSLSNIPAGWALCDGNDGTPDLRDRFILGAAAGEDPGATGGNHSYTLSASQLPSHRHWVDMPITGSHSHSYRKPYISIDLNGLIQGQGVEDYMTDTTGSAGNHDHDCYTNYTGGGQAFDNRPAYYKLAFIMKL